MPRGQPGRFVVFEGLDGAGTTTQAGLLVSSLRAGGRTVCATAEPSDGPIGAILRAHVRGEIDLDPPTAALAFVADRADHLARVVRPALERGEWVVCDRYLLSTLAYQGADGVDRRWILDASAGADVPDVTFFLDVPAAELAARLGTRGRTDRYEAPAMAERIRASYDVSIGLLRDRGHRIDEIDGTRPPEVLSALVRSGLDSLPGEGV